MNIQCFYKGKPAYWQGVDKAKRMYKVETLDGEIHYVGRLAQLEFKNHFKQKDLFTKTA